MERFFVLSHDSGVTRRCRRLLGRPGQTVRGSQQQATGHKGLRERRADGDRVVRIYLELSALGLFSFPTQS